MKNWNQASKKEKLAVFTRIALEKEIKLDAAEKDWWTIQSIHLIFQTRLSSHLIFIESPLFNKKKSP